MQDVTPSARPSPVGRTVASVATVASGTPRIAVLAGWPTVLQSNQNVLRKGRPTQVSPEMSCHRGRARCAVKTSNLNVPQLPYEIWEKILYELAHREFACHPQANREPMLENTCSCEGCTYVDTAAGSYLTALFQI